MSVGVRMAFNQYSDTRPGAAAASTRITPAAMEFVDKRTPARCAGCTRVSGAEPSTMPSDPLNGGLTKEPGWTEHEEQECDDVRHHVLHPAADMRADKTLAEGLGGADDHPRN